MSGEITSETVPETAEEGAPIETKAEKLLRRQKRAAKMKRGKGIVLIRKIEVPEGQSELVIEGIGAVKGGLYEVVASENQAMRKPEHVKEWMEENKFLGSVYPIRVGKPITRAEQLVTKFV